MLVRFIYREISIIGVSLQELVLARVCHLISPGTELERRGSIPFPLANLFPLSQCY